MNKIAYRRKHKLKTILFSVIEQHCSESRRSKKEARWQGCKVTAVEQCIKLCVCQCLCVCVGGKEGCSRAFITHQWVAAELASHAKQASRVTDSFFILSASHLLPFLTDLLFSITHLILLLFLSFISLLFSLLHFAVYLNRVAYFIVFFKADFLFKLYYFYYLISVIHLHCCHLFLWLNKCAWKCVD